MPPPQKLAILANVFGIGIDDLIGVEKNKSKKIETTNPRLLSKLALVEKLPIKAQKDIVSMIEHLAKAYNVK